VIRKLPLMLMYVIRKLPLMLMYVIRKLPSGNFSE